MLEGSAAQRQVAAARAAPVSTRLGAPEIGLDHSGVALHLARVPSAILTP